MLDYFFILLLRSVASSSSRNSVTMTVNAGADGIREKALADYRKKLIEHKEVESRLKDSKYLKVPMFLQSH